MAKQSAKPDIPADMWLHVATDALAKYAVMEDAEGVAVGFSPEGMTIYITSLQQDDPRFAPSFAAIIADALKRPTPQEEPPTP